MCTSPSNFPAYCPPTPYTPTPPEAPVVRLRPVTPACASELLSPTIASKPLLSPLTPTPDGDEPCTPTAPVLPAMLMPSTAEWPASLRTLLNHGVWTWPADGRFPWSPVPSLIAILSSFDARCVVFPRARQTTARIVGWSRGSPRRWGSLPRRAHPHRARLATSAA